MKKLCFIVGCVLMLSSSSVQAQTTNNAQVIMVRLEQTGINNSILVANGSEQVEVIDIRKAKKQSVDEADLIAWQKVIANLYQQGYVLQSTLSGVQLPNHVDNWRYSTLIFVKAPKP